MVEAAGHRTSRAEEAAEVHGPNRGAEGIDDDVDPPLRICRSHLQPVDELVEGGVVVSQARGAVPPTAGAGPARPP
ncbi:MAG: hypothetical protein A2V84_04495 [Chloroflexi bacterium RBG_16_70_13]|nr:MAG: hypothetical protein A2V84_04495 [Chloroflexi bacterium RBG_16_70_13]